MPNSLDEDEIQELLRVYHETGENKSATSDRIDRSRSTVSRYVEERYDEWLDDDDEDGASPAQEIDDGGDGGAGADTMTATSDPSNMSAGPTIDDGEQDFSPGFDDDHLEEDSTTETVSLADETGSEIEADEESVQDLAEALTGEDENPYSGMGYGEFIKEFFEKEDFGTRDKWENAVAKMAEMRGELPDQRSMENALDQGSSGVNNDFMHYAIAESYWNEAEQFLSAKSDESGPAVGGAMVGNWRGAKSGGPGQSGQGFDSGNWESHGPRGRGQGQSSPYQGQGQGQGQGPPQPGRWDERGRQTDPEIEQLKDAMKGMQETQKKLIQRMQQDDSNDESVTDELQEYVRLKQMIDELGDDNDDVEKLSRQFQSELRNLRQQVNNQEVSGGEGNEMTMLAKLAANENIDDDTLDTMASIMGTSDPEVKRAEYELKKEEVKSENRREMMDSFFSNLEGVADSVVGAGIDSMLGGDDDSGDSGGEPEIDGELPPLPSEDEFAPADDGSYAPPTRDRFERVQAQQQAEREMEGEMGAEPAPDGEYADQNPGEEGIADGGGEPRGDDQ